ncbi:hypothetical protein M427DRAFT_266009 [Gonapodya prolifera JEL478]|uniref:Methyltransferase FkbM domain-containing protein n=1 Tax=Gonapodya prolifera (strain JEL478) TaxID=1344416 RepID=A0A139AKE9_GONPJ|nr:hypothetical protein M427DRAFT_266009 [Gonapodya prolifera JEL478]|eukprot:KXS17262.1 hypothetical protein M427DRAFT_266009 [Gonapodya prolifera JEL478]
MLAGRAGYPSLAFDLQRRCARLFHCAAYWNNYKRHEIRLGYVTDAETAASGKLIEADSESCVGGRSPRQFPSFTGERIMVPPIDLTEFILKRGVQVAALKIDTEGYEPIILRSLVPLLALRAIPDLIVEFTPYAWSSLGVSVEDFLMGTVRDMYEEWGMVRFNPPVNLKMTLTAYFADCTFAPQCAGWSRSTTRLRVLHHGVPDVRIICGASSTIEQRGLD